MHNDAALVEQYLPLVRSIAAQLARKLPPSIEVDDLVQEGCLAMCRGVKRFRPGKFTFGAFIRRRVHGAMLDSIRRKTWRHVTALPLAAASELASQESIEEALNESQEQAERKRQVDVALLRLTAREAKLVHLHYREGATIGRAARAIGVQHNRATEIHRDALAKLKCVLPRAA